MTGRRIIWIIFYAVFGVLFFEKGMSLLGAIHMVDDSGMGLSFLGFEVSDQISAWHIIYYSIGFILLGATLFCTAFIKVFKYIRKVALGEHS
ncbi:hypothetical protein DRW41_16305 [Neobacillus piezotolerans]|uniref:Uncharacterized protein n=1 Tax=Neobacillus piezotolerans TaxID=2259171 RepID=A0A3D8GMI8_9BACI|nr:hypothetical protein [Neobacillus piezotolerans]RDU35705.1 hypothetical protein DRW41_16305 [Neobacillus piezotolerans]